MTHDPQHKSAKWLERFTTKGNWNKWGVGTLTGGQGGCNPTLPVKTHRVCITGYTEGCNYDKMIMSELLICVCKMMKKAVILYEWNCIISKFKESKRKYERK